MAATLVVLAMALGAARGATAANSTEFMPDLVACAQSTTDTYGNCSFTKADGSFSPSAAVCDPACVGGVFDTYAVCGPVPDDDAFATFKTGLDALLEAGGCGECVVPTQGISNATTSAPLNRALAACGFLSFARVGREQLLCTKECADAIAAAEGPCRNDTINKNTFEALYAVFDKFSSTSCQCYNPTRVRPNNLRGGDLASSPWNVVYATCGYRTLSTQPDNRTAACSDECAAAIDAAHEPCSTDETWDLPWGVFLAAHKIWVELKCQCFEPTVNPKDTPMIDGPPMNQLYYHCGFDPDDMTNFNQTLLCSENCTRASERAELSCADHPVHSNVYKVVKLAIAAARDVSCNCLELFMNPLDYAQPDSQPFNQALYACGWSKFGDYSIKPDEEKGCSAACDLAVDNARVACENSTGNTAALQTFRAAHFVFRQLECTCLEAHFRPKDWPDPDGPAYNRALYHCGYADDKVDEANPSGKAVCSLDCTDAIANATAACDEHPLHSKTFKGFSTAVKAARQLRCKCLEWKLNPFSVPDPDSLPLNKALHACGFSTIVDVKPDEDKICSSACVAAHDDAEAQCTASKFQESEFLAFKAAYTLQRERLDCPLLGTATTATTTRVSTPLVLGVAALVTMLLVLVA